MCNIKLNQIIRLPKEIQFMDTVVIVLWIVGLIFVLVTLINIIKRSIKTKRCTTPASAIITDVKEKVSRRNNVMSREFTPTISYNVNGKQFSREFAKAYVADTYHVGQSIEIMVNPNKPEEINKLGSSNKADLVMLVIGVVIIIIGVLFLVF
jgi:hypothetical protein